MSTRKTSRASYQCGQCQKYRQLGFYDDEHQPLVEQSNNGLVNYSDIHTCKDSLTGINLLSVDREYNIRSFDRLELPKMRIVGNVPTPNTGTDKGIKFIHITQMPNNLDIHLIIHDYMILSDIKIGRFNHEEEVPLTTLMSDMGMIHIDIYPSGTAFTREIERWFQHLAGIIEVLPATTLGLLVDTLRYIADNADTSPTEYDVNFIKTILASHEVFFKVLENYKEKLGRLRDDENSIITDTHLRMIDKFIRVMLENDEASMRDFTVLPGVDMNLFAIIYLFSILEAEGIIRMERPGILGNFS